MPRWLSIVFGFAACHQNRFEADTDWCPDDFAEASFEGLADVMCTYVQKTCPSGFGASRLEEYCANGGAAGFVEYWSHVGDCVIPCNVRTCYQSYKRAVEAGDCVTDPNQTPPDACHMLYFRYYDDNDELTCGDLGVYWGTE